jgi:hypothetical protein
MKRIIKTFYNFINESEAIPTGAEIVDILTSVFGSSVSYGDPNVYHMYIGGPEIKTNGTIGSFARVDLNLKGKKIILSGADPSRPDDRRETGSVIFNFLLAAGAKQIPYKKKDGTFGGYLNNVLSYDELSLTQIKKMIADLHAKYPHKYYYEGKWQL